MGSDERFDGYGNVVVVSHTNGRQYFLAHLNSGPQNEKELTKRQKERLEQIEKQKRDAKKVASTFQVIGNPVTLKGIDTDDSTKLLLLPIVTQAAAPTAPLPPSSSSSIPSILMSQTPRSAFSLNNIP